MPTQSTNTSVGIQATANEKWVVNAGVTVSSSIDDAFSASPFDVNNVGLVNHGTLLSTYEGGHGVYIRGENSTVTNSASGKITGVLAGIAANGLGSTIDNKGTIRSDVQFGIVFSIFSADIALTNSGTIFGKTAGVEVLTSGDGGSITNSGLIDSNGRGIYVGAGAGPTIINNEAGGTIEGSTSAIFTSASFLYPNGSIRLTNLGRVVGNIDCDAPDEADTVVNSGTITGETRLGSGNDQFVFGGGEQGTVLGEAASDRFDFTTKLAPKKAAAVIGDFTPGEDLIGLSNKLFKKIGKEGELKKKAFEVGKKADDKSDRVIYNEKKGELYFDKDGSGGAGQKLIAKIGSGLDLAASDILVIA